MCGTGETCCSGLPKPGVLWPNDNRDARLYIDSRKFRGENSACFMDLIIYGFQPRVTHTSLCLHFSDISQLQK